MYKMNIETKVNTVNYHTCINFNIEDVLISCMLDSGFFYTNTLTYESHLHLAYELHYVIKGIYDM